MFANSLKHRSAKFVAFFVLCGASYSYFGLFGATITFSIFYTLYMIISHSEIINRTCDVYYSKQYRWYINIFGLFAILAPLYGLGVAWAYQEDLPNVRHLVYETNLLISNIELGIPAQHFYKISLTDHGFVRQAILVEHIFTILWLFLTLWYFYGLLLFEGQYVRVISRRISPKTASKTANIIVIALLTMCFIAAVRFAIIGSKIQFGSNRLFANRMHERVIEFGLVGWCTWGLYLFLIFFIIFVSKKGISFIKNQRNRVVRT